LTITKLFSILQWQKKRLTRGQKIQHMVNCKPAHATAEPLGELFVIDYKEKKYTCRAIQINGRVVYQVNFNSSYLYLTKSINQHGIPFWTSIPQDLKLRRIVEQLGKQLEDHLIKVLCVTTTALK